MEEKEFWNRLEFRVCGEIAGLQSNEFRGWWCDGFIPDRLGLVGDSPALIGTVWMARGGREQWAWHFALLLREAVQTIDDINWAESLPPEDITGWLSLDAKKKEMKIDLAAAHPDLTASSET